MLRPEQRKTLLDVARRTIEGMLTNQPVEWQSKDFDEELQRPAGTFVTLTEREELRGCIGSIHPSAPLFKAVATSAFNAAFRDPRFAPVSSEEWAAIAIEISVMGPIVRVEDPNEILVGRDGLILSFGGRSGLLLPQVATDYGWDRDTFLQKTSLKAGLPLNAWRQPGATLERFSAEVFGEKH